MSCDPSFPVEHGMEGWPDSSERGRLLQILFLYLEPMQETRNSREILQEFWRAETKCKGNPKLKFPLWAENDTLKDPMFMLLEEGLSQDTVSKEIGHRS